MPIVATPEVGIPLPFDTTPEEIDDFRQKAHALFETVQELIKQGAEVEVTPEDKAQSHQIATSGKIPPAKYLTPGTIVNLEAILNEWDQEVLDVSRRLRNYVTNKLIVESVDPDPRQRMKALENLGKIANVGLFSERIDINITHRTVNDIETDLMKTLELYGGVTDVTPKEAEPKSIADIDVDEELGEDDEPRAAT
jgi:Txe/YoeB family toxin of Txe-Axe toxin-antitoxin module